MQEKHEQMSPFSARQASEVGLACPQAPRHALDNPDRQGLNRRAFAPEPFS
jgi:hypothetical protein